MGTGISLATLMKPWVRPKNKYYISVIEGTAPAIVLQRFDSPNLSPPLPACSVRRAGSPVYCRQSRDRLDESNICKTMAVAVPSITDIYSLGAMIQL